MGEAMRLALGLSVHTGWAACVLAGGSLREPHLAARERVDLLDDPARFVFHRAAEMSRPDAERAIAQAEKDARARAMAALRRVADGRDVQLCAIAAKPGSMPDLGEVLASHPRIHTAEGFFYRDVLMAAAKDSGIATQVVPLSKLDPNAPALAAAGRIVGKPWNRDWKIAALAAWHALK
jgi:hypothetical protein